SAPRRPTGRPDSDSSLLFSNSGEKRAPWRPFSPNIGFSLRSDRGGVAAASESFVQGGVIDRPSLAGKLVDELDGAGLLVGGDEHAAVLDHVELGHVMTLTDDHDRLDRLSPRLVGHADDGRLLDALMLLQRTLDFGRVDVLGRRLDQPSFGPDPGQRTVGLAPAEIVRVVPLASKALDVQLVAVEKAVHDGRTARHDLAHLAGRHLVTVQI